jgi:hypothetical protein
MKKFIIFAVVLALLAPTAAFAKAEFSLGGYVKMLVAWDSTQVNTWLYYAIPRNNDLTQQHGRLKFSAENTRMNFTIKGPNLWGAKTMAYIEWDFDNAGNQLAGWASPNKCRLALRHAFFRFNWPETELLMGQYWSVLTEEVPETVNFGAGTTAGFPFRREPQIRVTQMFGVGGGKLTASLVAAQPTNDLWGLATNTTQTALGNQYTGESSETPQVEVRLKYDIDLWGKAAFWGVPRPFSVRLGGAWQRARFVRYDDVALRGFDSTRWLGAVVPGQYNAVANCFTKQEYLDKYMAQASLFIPILVTHTKNLAGTASLMTQWWIGAGMDTWIEDMPNNASFMTVDSTFGNNKYCDRELTRRYGGFIQLQYYFTNQWYVNAVWLMNRAYGIDRVTWLGEGGADPWRSNQQYYIALWYRPIQAVKFGLEYTYCRTDYYQNALSTGGVPQNWVNGMKTQNVGENNRVIFAGYYFF